MLLRKPSENRKVNGRTEQDIWADKAPESAFLGGLAIAELGDTDVKEPKALRGALDALDKSGVYDKMKGDFLKAVDKRLHLAPQGEADKLITQVEQVSPRAANDIKESRKAA